MTWPKPTLEFFQRIRRFRQRTFKAYAADEVEYLRVLNEILIKKEWWVKMQDPAILNRWKVESNLSDSTWTILEEEVKHIASKLLAQVPLADDPASKGTIVPASSPGVFLSDNMIGAALQGKLVELTKPLEKEALEKEEYHPGSDNKVLNLVHPSPYCLVYGRTMASETPGSVSGQSIIEFPADVEIPRWANADISKKFQWLPAEVSVDTAGSVKFESYINNLNPHKYSALMKVIALILQSAMPMLSRSLASFFVEPFQRMDADTSKYYPEHENYEWFGIKYRRSKGLPDDAEIDESDPAYEEFTDNAWDNRDEMLADRPMLFTPSMTDFKRIDAKLVTWDADIVKADASSNIYESQYKLNQDIHGANPNVDPTFLEFPYKGRNLQVIVKLANIHLTPEKPTYSGGEWHVEGMENDAIASTAIYYYDVENITESRLTFRHEFSSEDWNYGQSDFSHLEKLFGFHNEETEEVQSFGSMVAQQGRLVTFPNYAQHKVEPFELADKTKPGNRKMIAFFLIHPNFPIVSTKHVPPQQREWAMELMDASFSRSFPSVVKENIMQFSGSTMTRAEAHEYAKQLSDERKYFVDNNNRNIRTVFLCEH